MISASRKRYVAAIRSNLFPHFEGTQLGERFLDHPLTHRASHLASVDQVNDEITEIIATCRPAMISRFGSVELRGLLEMSRITGYSWGEKALWAMLHANWPRWTSTAFEYLGTSPGVFPTTDRHTVEEFVNITARAAHGIDILGSWVPGENHVKGLPESVTIAPLANLEPFFSSRPWTHALAGKRVLIVHPFADSIKSQYSKRKLIFGDRVLLPEFEMLQIVPPQTTNAKDNFATIPFPNWLSAYENLLGEIKGLTYDVAIIGAGSYGMPLASEIKKSGKVAVHLGGSTQLLFGIWGRRWDLFPQYSQLRSEHWTKPLSHEIPGSVFKEGRGDSWAYY